MSLQLAFVVSTTGNPYWNLAVENYLVDESAADQLTLYLWRNDRTVVVGRHQNPFTECDIDLLLAEGGSLLRRTTGGGAVYHDYGNLNFSFVVPSDVYSVARQFDVIGRALMFFGLRSEPSGRNDLLVDGRKFSGNAFSKGRCHHLHHGTLLISGNLGDMQRYLHPHPSKLARHGVASVRSRVVNLADLAPVTAENIQPLLRDAFGQVYGAPPVDIAFDDLLQLGGVRQRHDLYASPAWLTDGWADFSTECSASFPWGDVVLHLTVASGTVKALRIATDALDVASITALQQLLQGASIAHLPPLPDGVDPTIASDIYRLVTQ